MPHRRPKPSIVLGAVAALAVASPVAAFHLGPSSQITTTDSSSAAVPTDIAEVVLASIPDIVVPLKELTGLDLPDLHMSDLKRLGLPGLPASPGDIAAPSAPPVPTDPAAPVSPDQLPPDVADQLGATVKEITRDTPFSMIALTAKKLAGSDARVRAKQPDGTWGPWLSTDRIETSRSDKGAEGKAGTEPVYVGNTNTVQVLLEQPTPAPAPSPEPLGYRPAAFSTPLHQEPADASDDGLAAQLIEPGGSEADANLDSIAEPLSGGGPKVISRSQWGADESIRCSDPDIDDFTGGATVHHTAGSNDYSKSESAGIVRAIYAYHAKTLGWCDIGYNALVDKYGQVFEGRAGGLDKPVQGAHAGGFNENTVGVAMMGNFVKQAPTEEQLQATGKFLGWRLKLAKLDPKAKTTMYSEGTSYTRYAEGEAVELPVIFAHRDVGDTECPGDAAYAKMDEIRDIAAAAAGSGSDAAAPAPDPRIEAAAPAPAQPPVSDSTPVPPPPPASDPTPVPIIPELAARVLGATDPSPIAQRWVQTGGAAGPLGASESEVLPAKDGRQYAKFAGGYIYSAPTGQIVTVLGKIFDEFAKLGFDAGSLGLPTTDEYPVPEGMRADFEHGSLIFNQITGFVTTLLQTYKDSYEKEYNKPAG